MIAASVLFLLICGCTITSADIFGVEVNVNEEWWLDGYFLKFNSPSGKDFYIDNNDGTIYREKKAIQPLFGILFGPPLSELNTTDSDKSTSRPYITFVSLGLKIYDIFFESDLNYAPKIVESKFTYNVKFNLIRHRLHSFVGPNKQVYKIVYNEGNVSDISISDPVEHHDYIQIKTFGPYTKWEHSYEFSDSSEIVTDHFVSPVEILPNRSIPLPEVAGDSLVEKGRIELFVKFNTPSTKTYHITDRLDIALIREDDNSKTETKSYINFFEPNGRTYDIYLTNNNEPTIVEQKYDENHWGGSQRLFSFTGPNKKLYRIDRNKKNDHEVPILVPVSDDETMDLQITALIPNKYYNKYVKYIFSDNGTHLFDRVDEIDWTPLNEEPALPLEEIDANSEIAASSYLTFYSPSGKNYHIITNESSEESSANIVVESSSNYAQEDAGKRSYIRFIQPNGKNVHIYFTPGDHPYIEEDMNETQLKNSTGFGFLSFATPDRKKYLIKWNVDNGIETPSIQLPFQMTDPVTEIIEENLSIKMQDNRGWQYIYEFTWNGDKLVYGQRLPPSQSLDPKIFQSLIDK